MGGLFGIGGSSAHTNRKFQLSSMADLSNLFNQLIPMGTSTFASGQQATGGAQSFWQKILSGSRQALEGVVAPERNAALSAADAQKRQAATMGTARTGGVAAQNRTIGDRVQQSIDAALLGMRPEAAGELAKTGNAQMEAAIRALGLGGETADALGKVASTKPATADLAAAEGQMVAGGLLGFLGV